MVSLSEADSLKINPSMKRVASLFTYGLAVGVFLVSSGLLALWLCFPALKAVAVLMMKANTAAALAIASVSLWCLRNSDARIGKLGRFLALVVCLIGALTSFEYLLGADFGIDQLLVSDFNNLESSQFPGRMSPISSVCFVLLGTSLYFIDSRLARSKINILYFCIIPILFLSVLAVTGYVFDVHFFYKLGPYIRITWITASCLFALGVGTLLARPERGLFGLILSPTSGGIMARRMIPASILVPLFFGWLGVKAYEAGQVDFFLGTAILSVLLITVFCFILLLNARALFEHDNERVRIIDELTAAQAALKKMNEELEFKVEARTRVLARSNAELEQFAYIASHDLQTPLRHVTSYVQLLADKVRRTEGFDAQSAKWVEYILGGTRQMKILITDLLEYSRIGRVDIAIEEVDIGEIIGEVSEILREPIKTSNAKIEYADMPRVKGVRSQLLQLFQNLIENAIKFRRLDVEPVIEIRCGLQEEAWKFSVCDNGIGIDSKYSDKIFIMFQRLHTDSEYSGTGIGLAVCKKIAEFHGGKIGVNSRVGIGSTFYFDLPKTPRA